MAKSRRPSQKDRSAGNRGLSARRPELRSAPARKQLRAKAKSGRSIVSTDRAPKPVGPYNQAVVAGNTVYVAGQGPIDPFSGELVIGSFEEQAIQTFENLKAILDAAGSSLGDVVKVNVYLSDISDFAKMNEIYRRYFPDNQPARATIGAQLLFHTFIEVDCIAVKPAH